MADVYSRLQDRRISLVAFACAIAGPNMGQTPLTSFNEINLWVRLLRESGLLDHALAECKWQTLPASATLVVMESELRSMPSNLLWTSNGFFGASQPVGAAPSMAWLAESFSRRPADEPRLNAWISNAGDPTQTLNVLLGYLEGEFQEYGVALDTSNHPPATLAGSDLVFIAAHGQVSPEAITSIP
jgi:hypothetical protein